MNGVRSSTVCMVVWMSVALGIGALPRAGLAAGTDLAQWRITELERQVRELTRRIEAMENRVLPEVRDLTRRVEALERREILSKRPPAPHTGTIGDWQDRTNWQKLHRGMTAEEVRSLLGKPDYAEVGSERVQWRYGSRDRGPQVAFEKDSMTVESWEAPR